MVNHISYRPKHNLDQFPLFMENQLPSNKFSSIMPNLLEIYSTVKREDKRNLGQSYIGSSTQPKYLPSSPSSISFKYPPGCKSSPTILSGSLRSLSITRIRLPSCIDQWKIRKVTLESILTQFTSSTDFPLPCMNVYFYIFSLLETSESCIFS